MHPAFSVILFTTLSGSGYGLLALLGLQRLLQPAAFTGGAALGVYGFALTLVTVGLLASLWHLGQPTRAWRAVTQWRTSWLSREGVASLLTYVPALAALWLAWNGGDDLAARATGGVLCVASLVTVACTAMIYVSLPPIPAWSDRAVLPGYLAYALLGGAWWLLAALALLGAWVPGWAAAAVALLALALGLLKHAYWRRIERPALPSAAAAIGLPSIGTVRSFERPHTERNYLLREMGFVLARRHARRLRALALGLGLLLPVLLLVPSVLWPATASVALPLAALIFQLGALVERWLFFAQARHTIQSYYGVPAPA
jgi:sulfite dehydrogenase (quinone) subunit SoeC